MSVRSLVESRVRVWLNRPALNRNPYATHLPALAALGLQLHPRRVLELGSGVYSTQLFLMPDCFPRLAELVSLEDNAQWADKVAEGTLDPRLSLQRVHSVPECVPDDLSQFDLVFIDDSTSLAKRSSTIRAVASRRPRGVVVVHDFEHSEYRDAAQGFDNVRVFRHFLPYVGILWNDPPPERLDVGQADRAVRQVGSRDLSDLDGWMPQLRSALKSGPNHVGGTR